MTKKTLKVPSLQHLARLWHPDPLRVQRTLVALAKNSPTFSYQLVYELVHDLVCLKVPYGQIEDAVRKKVKRVQIRENFLELLPLVRTHFADVGVDFVHQVTRRFYPLGRDLFVPFSPSFIYGSRGELHLPWMSFWKENPLDAERLSLFMTVVDDVLAQDPDLEAATFSLLDFSAPAPRSPRSLKVLKGEEIPRVSRERQKEMLGVFIEGFRLAQQELEGAELSRTPVLDRDEDQLPLF